MGGCKKTPVKWYEEFISFDKACVTKKTAYVIKSLTYLADGTNSTIPEKYLDALNNVFTNTDVTFIPDNKKYPDYTVIRNVRKPNISLFIKRHGWNYCVDAPLSTSLFTPLRRIRY